MLGITKREVGVYVICQNRGIKLGWYSKAVKKKRFLGVRTSSLLHVFHLIYSDSSTSKQPIFTTTVPYFANWMPLCVVNFYCHAYRTNRNLLTELSTGRSTERWLIKIDINFLTCLLFTHFGNPIPHQRKFDDVIYHGGKKENGESVMDSRRCVSGLRSVTQSHERQCFVWLRLFLSCG